MKISEIRPSLHRISYFQYVQRDRECPKISFEKSQYVYHILLLDKGMLDVCVGGKTERIKAGDALYLLPGEVYRLIPCEEDFSLYNLFFDFLDDRAKAVSNTCVFMKYYDARICLPGVVFEDAAVLNKSGVIKNVFCAKALKQLLYTAPTDALYGFYSLSAIFSVIADILTTDKSNEKKGSAAEPILEYIRSNPEGDLSGDALSRLFSYHKNHINKLVKRETGRALGEYVRYVKIEYAKTLLLENLYSTSEIATRLGYYDYSHFYKAFLEETGDRPTEYISNRRGCGV